MLAEGTRVDAVTDFVGPCECEINTWSHCFVVEGTQYASNVDESFADEDIRG